MEPEKKLKNFTPTGSCPVRDVLCRLGDKWSMLVLLTLNANGVMRFSEIHRTLGDISHRMLTVTLRMLETDGMIRREVYAEVPPRVEYRLTERGGSLLPHIFVYGGNLQAYLILHRLQRLNLLRALRLNSVAVYALL